MNEPYISVGIVTWNSQKYLPMCFEGLKIQDVPFELIVVDNNSIDLSLEITKHYFPDAIIIKNIKNEGFCRAHNQAIATSRGKFYLALNPDVRMTSGYIRSMFEELQQYPSAGSVTGKLLLDGSDNPPRIDTTGLFIDKKRRQYLRGHGEIDNGQFNFCDDVFGTDGAAPLYRKDMLEDISINGEYFDQIFFAHKEDIDLAWRARLYGWNCRYTNKAVAYHDRSFRPGKRKPMSDDVKGDGVKNRYLLLMKNEILEGIKRDFIQILFYDLKIFVYLTLFERSSIKAIFSLKSLFPRVREWRKIIMSHRKVASQDILKWFF